MINFLVLTKRYILVKRIKKLKIYFFLIYFDFYISIMGNAFITDIFMWLSNMISLWADIIKSSNDGKNFTDTMNTVRCSSWETIGTNQRVDNN